jgi:gliding motility-associated-like protein
VTPSADTDYFVEVINSNSCSQVGGRDIVSVIVNPLPSIDAGLDETICPGDNVTLTATGTGTFSWSTTETTSSINVSPSLTTIYTVTLTDANTCENSGDVLVTVQSIGGSLIAIDDAFNADEGVATNYDVLLNDTYSGTSPTVIGGPTSGTAIVEADGTITYTGSIGFEGTDTFVYTICDAFCVSICDTAEVTVAVKTDVEIGIPGGFSPNGDGINDGFVIVGLDQFPDNTLQVFNRWGTMVYSAEPYNNNWDGSSTESGVLVGGELPVGTYFFILDLGNDSSPIRGTFELKRN